MLLKNNTTVLLKNKKEIEDLVLKSMDRKTVIWYNLGNKSLKFLPSLCVP